MNNISLAETQIEQAVNAKFAPNEEAINIAINQLNVLKPSLTADEKIQADALTASYEAQKQQIADAKTEMTNIKNIWLEYYKNGGADANIANKITNAKTLQEAMNIYAANLPKEIPKTSAIYTEWQDYQRTGGKLTFDAYMTMDANRKRSVNNTYIDTGAGSYDEIKNQLEASKNNSYTTADGKVHQGDGIYANTDVYKRLRNQAKDKTAFDKNYSTILNPNDPTALPFISNVKTDVITPEKQSIINDAKAAIDQVKQRYGDLNATRSQIIDQEKQQSGFDLSPYI